MLFYTIRLVNVKEMKETMGTMAREMERAGLIEEIVGDTMDMMDVSVVNNILLINIK